MESWTQVYARMPGFGRDMVVAEAPTARLHCPWRPQVATLTAGRVLQFFQCKVLIKLLRMSIFGLLDGPWRIQWWYSGAEFGTRRSGCEIRIQAMIPDNNGTQKQKGLTAPRCRNFPLFGPEPT
jgi:hypothetical protein